MVKEVDPCDLYEELNNISPEELSQLRVLQETSSIYAS